MSAETINFKTSRIFAIAAAVLLLLGQVLSLRYFTFFNIVNLVFTILIIVSLLENKKDKILLAGAAGKAALCLINLLRYFSFYSFVELVAYLALLVLVLMKTMPNLNLETYIKDELKKYIRFVPAAAILLLCIIKWVLHGFGFFSLLASVIEIAAIFILGMWLSI